MKKVKIGFSFIVLCIVCICVKQFALLINYFLALLLHELAHLFVATKRGYKLKTLKLTMFGVSINLDAEVDEHDSFAINIAGPMCNLILCVLCVALYWLIPQSFVYLNCFCISNLVLALFNLMPIYPLDGGKVFYGLIKNKKVYRWLDIVIRVVFCAISVVLFLCSIKTGVNWFYLVIAIFFIISYTKPEPTFSLLKFNKRKNIEKVVLLKVGKEDDLLKLLKQIKRYRYTIFYCNQTNKKYLDEDCIISLSTTYPLTTKLQDIF